MPMIDWDEYKKERTRIGMDRREKANTDYLDAVELADFHGMDLRMRSKQHYQLRPRSGGWLLNLYPGNCRIWSDRNRPRAPFLNMVGQKWILLDVVKAAIEAAHAADL